MLFALKKIIELGTLQKKTHFFNGRAIKEGPPRKKYFFFTFLFRRSAIETMGVGVKARPLKKKKIGDFLLYDL